MVNLCLIFRSDLYLMETAAYRALLLLSSPTAAARASPLPDKKEWEEDGWDQQSFIYDSDSDDLTEEDEIDD